MPKDADSCEGVIVVDKEQGISSFAEVRRLRRILRAKKAGHTGTLDPMATGVLVICLGRATKIIQYLNENKKRYTAEIILGIRSDTYDITGRIFEVKPVVNIANDDIKRELLKLKEGDWHTPPMFSAIKRNGIPLYKFAREGQSVERKDRRYKIYSLDIKEIKLPRVTIEILCSRGTYVRSLIDSFGLNIGTGALLSSLRRTASGQFSIDTALKVGSLHGLKRQTQLREAIIPIDKVLKRSEFKE